MSKKLEYPVERMNYIAEHAGHLYAAEKWLHSGYAIQGALKGEPVACPTCYGHKKLALFMSRASSKPQAVEECPTCKGTGMVVRPVYGISCLEGGWGICPYCFEGQNPNDKACDICQWWLDELSK